MGINKVQYGNTTLIDLTSDTVQADKLMQGYTAHDRTGALITGTATGGGSGGNVWQDAQGYVHLDDEGAAPITVESLSVTQNGTYTAPTGKAYSPVTVNVSGGGGASNIVQGTFTTGATEGVGETLSIPYTGTGYPVSFTIYVSGGIRNNTAGGNSEWYNLLQRYVVAEWHMLKCQTTTAPTYASSGEENECNTTVLYKGSTSNPDYYSVSTSKNYAALGAENQSASGASYSGCVRFKGDGTTVSYFVASTSYGLLKDTEYAYIAVYSE